MAFGAKNWIVAVVTALINIVSYFFLPSVLIFNTEGMGVSRLLFLAVIPIVEFVLVIQAKTGRRPSGCFGAQIVLLVADILVIAMNLIMF